jgi:predicted nucleotidyltransferase
MQAPHQLVGAASSDVQPIIHGIVDLFEAVFPGRVRGYYLLGSHVEGTAVALSDIDLIVLFKDGFASGEVEQARRVIDACGQLSPVRLDVTPESEAALRIEDLRLKLGSRLVAGEDVRPLLPLPSPEAHARYIIGWPNSFIRRLHDGARLAPPLRYPDATDAFFGYARVRIPHWYPPATALGTKELVAATCWTANALLSLNLGAAGFVGTKGEAISRYRDLGDGEWGSFVADSYARCKSAWHYAVPEGAAERAELRTLCQRALPFFNHYLEVYRDYLGNQHLATDATQRHWAEQQLSELAAD